MPYKSVYNDVIFIEGNSEFVKSLGQVEYKKDKLYNNQLQNIDNVKEQLSRKAKELGGNAIINFKYGQKSTTWFRSMLLAFDDNVNWFGNGEVVVLDDAAYQEILNQLKSTDK